MTAPAPAPTWRGYLKQLLIGALLISVPEVPLAWALRLVVAGWLFELGRRASEAEGPTSYPSWRPAWTHFKRGARGVFYLWLVLWLPSYLLHNGWQQGWVFSFEKVFEHLATGPRTVLAGMFLLAALVPALPLLWVEVARAPRMVTSRDLGRAYALAGASPVRYGFVLLATGLCSVVHQFMRQPQLPEFGGRFVVGLLSFALVMRLKLAWARQHRRAREALDAGEGAGPWLRRPILVSMAGGGFLWAFALLAVQFLNWCSWTEWFAHALFLIPGAPAPVGGQPLFW